MCAKKQKKFFLFLLVACPVIIPMEQLYHKKDLPYTELRRQFPQRCTIDQIKEITGDRVTFEEIPPGERYGECHNYAWSKIMGIVGKVPEVFKIVSGTASSYYGSSNFDIFRYCKIVSVPQPGDLILYLEDNKPLKYVEQIAHTGIVINDNDVESKWGTMRYRVIHPKWLVPHYYGNTLQYRRLTITGDELLQIILGKLQDPLVKKICTKASRHVQKRLFDAAAMKYTSTKSGVNPLEKGYYVRKIYILMERFMNIHIDARNKKNRTVLMVAAIAGNKSVIEFLVYYGAELDAQDSAGRTALILAAINSKFEVAEKLIKCGANEAIKDKRSKTAHDYFQAHIKKYSVIVV